MPLRCLSPPVVTHQLAFRFVDRSRCGPIVEGPGMIIVRVRLCESCMRTLSRFLGLPSARLWPRRIRSGRENRLRPRLLTLDHESFRETGQVAATVLGDDDEVLYADAADFRVVDAGLDGDDVAGDEPVVGEGNARGLVDL